MSLSRYISTGALPFERQPEFPFPNLSVGSGSLKTKHAPGPRQPSRPSPESLPLPSTGAFSVERR